MLTRRSFLALTAAGAASVSARPVQAIEPIARHGAARIKLSLAAYSFRNVLTGPQKSMTLDDFIDRAAAWDLDAVEPTSYYFPESPTPEYCRRLRRHAFLLGLGISGTAVRNTFTYPPGPQLQKEIAHVKHWVDLAVELGAPTIRIFAGDLQKGTTEAQARERVHPGAIPGVRRLRRHARHHPRPRRTMRESRRASTSSGRSKVVKWDCLVLQLEQLLLRGR